MAAEMVALKDDESVVSSAVLRDIEMAEWKDV